MGGFLSYFFADKGRTDDPNCITGFTSRDKYLINTTWTRVMENATEKGVTFFMRLFEVNPKHKEAFPFYNQPTEELPTDKKFQAHVTGVMYSISSIVKNMDDPELINSIITKIMQNHIGRSVDRQALLDVKHAFLDIFNFMNKEELESWSKFLDYFVKAGSKELERHLEEKK